MTDKNLAIAIEGGDGVGKNSLQMAMADLLLQNGFKVAITNYPQYWFFGSYIRKMLKNQMQDFLSQLSPEEELRLRAAMFSLDRAISLGQILPIIEQSPETILISDRGPWSNVLTAAYMSSTFPEIETLIDPTHLSNLIHELDAEMISELGLTPILAKHQDPAQGMYSEREKIDAHERSEVQQIASRYYEEMIPSSHQVVTRDNNGWKSLGSSAHEAISIAGIDLAQLSETQLSTMQLNYLGKQVVAGNLSLIGPRRFVEEFGINIDPILDTEISNWEGVTMMSDRQVALSFQAAQKKDVLNGIEANVSQMLVNRLAQASNFNLHNSSSSAVLRIISEFPEILELIELSGVNGRDLRSFIESIATGGHLNES